ncbi:GNAT family N-acetyltransferase [Paenibacillus chitinolyticus]|uniref:GNAT family N-acetyltransferase n=1 Tax=Paenibacillus chitinolyticus TaxID=79263 RepID=UPI002DBAB2D6|nr:GNAT family N-acetyltransferase [Paenibacillus chitinolyticus]MEC0248465.1 GNAT family N-acetyltransferase [Paenibacillus chitinolyticus]
MIREVKINLQIQDFEVPDLRESVGWDRRSSDYPALFDRCNFWAGVRSEADGLIAFGYVAGTGLQHGYMEDIIVHPGYHGQGIGKALVSRLLEEAARRGLEIVTVTFAEAHTSFYEKSGFKPCPGGLWRRGSN